MIQWYPLYPLLELLQRVMNLQFMGLFFPSTCSLDQHTWRQQRLTPMKPTWRPSQTIPNISHSRVPIDYIDTKPPSQNIVQQLRQTSRISNASQLSIEGHGTHWNQRNHSLIKRHSGANDIQITAFPFKFLPCCMYPKTKCNQYKNARRGYGGFIEQAATRPRKQ